MRTKSGRALLCILALCWPALGAAQSHNVVMIGGSCLYGVGGCYYYDAANYMSHTWGGMLPVTGPAGELGDFTFSPMMPADVSATSLAAYDTAVLNVASRAMACNTGNLTADQKQALIDFVGSGHKLIIFDSECPPIDYSWMPYPFSTANPGAMGAPGTLNILENNTLSSSDPTSEYFVDAVHLSTGTDAVGDMNVMTSFNPNWCVDMSGTNYLNVTGPVHTYAKYPAMSDTGLIIYNGLDQDFQEIDDTQLRKIWLFELKQPFNPSNLPCGFTIVGITLTPATASSPVGTAHTVTATLKDLLGHPRQGVSVTIDVLTGPNAGTSATADTDVNGVVSMTYTGTGVGIDELEACFVNQGVDVCSQHATKEWTNRPPVALCQDITIPGGTQCGGSASVDAGSYDPDGDAITLAQLPAGPYAVGTTPVTLTVTDIYGATASCQANVKVVDSEAPVVSCTPSFNPSGKNVPKASNEDGFFVVQASDGCSPGDLHVTLGDYPLTLGPSLKGLPIKLTQSPGFSGVTLVNVMGPEAIQHFRVGPGDAVLTADDGAGNATKVTCLVPPPPK